MMPSRKDFLPNNTIIKTGRKVKEILNLIIVKSSASVAHPPLQMTGPVNIILRHRHHNKERPLRFLSGRSKRTLSAQR
jgi:hypothetical protein